jgi:drug/metabolite transporter (DMT)-like permease
MAVQSNINQTQIFRTRVITAFAAVYLIWGSTYLAIRFTIETLPPFLSAGLRFVLAGLALYAFARYKEKEASPQKKHWGPAFITGGFLLLGGNGSVVWAERYVPSGLAALFIAITPLWMVLLEWWWHETKRPSAGVFFGIGIGFLGVWLLMAPDLLHQGSHSIHLGGALLLLFASLSWSIGSVYSRKADLPRSPFLSTAMQMIGGGSLLLLMGVLQGEYAHFHIMDFSVKSMLAWVYLVLFGSLLGFTAYLWLLKNVGVARASTYAFVNPVVAIFLGWALAGEKLDAQTAIAALFVLVAVILITIYHNEPKKSHHKEV